MQEYGAKPDRGAVHEHEFARHRHRSLLLERLVNAKSFAPAIFGWRDAVGDRAHSVVEQRRIDEARPDIERLDQIARQPAEPPSLVGVHDQVVLAAQQPVIKVDDAAHEFRRENSDATIVKKVDSSWRAVVQENSVIAEMRIAMDHAEAAERKPPGGKHRLGERVARYK